MNCLNHSKLSQSKSVVFVDMIEPAGFNGIHYVEIFNKIIVILNDILNYVLQEDPDTRMVCAVSDLVKENDNLKQKLNDALARVNLLEKRLWFFKCSINSIDKDGCASTVIRSYSDLETLKQDDGCNSLLKKYLTEEVLDNLIELETGTFNSTISHCIQMGILMHGSSIGLFAADADCYTVFAELFDPIIHDCHPDLSFDFMHPELNWGDPNSLFFSDEMHLYMEKCFIFCSRSLEMQPFFPKMKEKHYIHVIEAIRTILENFCGRYSPGSFYALEAVDEDTRARLKGEGFMFDIGDEEYQAAGSSRHWPIGRAVYISQDKSFVTYINHKNHIRFGCIQKDGNLKKMYEQFVNYGRIFDERLPCARHPKYGWLTASPTLLGNTLEIQARIRLIKLPKEIKKFDEILEKSNLKLAEQVTTANHIFCELRSTRCLGLTEFDTIQMFSAGIENVIRAEREM